GPAPSLGELSEMGQAIQIAPFILPGVQEVWKLLLEVKRQQSTLPIDEYVAAAYGLADSEAFVGMGDVFIRPTYEDVRKLEEKYSPPEMQRDYENTIHD